MSHIHIDVPEPLRTRQAGLEASLHEIAVAEGKLIDQRKEIQAALSKIVTAIAILSGRQVPASMTAPSDKPVRRPMSQEARQRIAEGLRKSAQARAQAKATQMAVPAPETAPTEQVTVLPTEPRRKPAPARNRARNR